MAEDRQGTGKHPHKSTEEPYPHTKESQSQQRSGESNRDERSGGSAGSSQSKNESKASENSDLKSREYRDNQGEVHHHTRTFEEEHGKKSA